MAGAFQRRLQRFRWVSVVLNRVKETDLPNHRLPDKGPPGLRSKTLGYHGLKDLLGRLRPLQHFHGSDKETRIHPEQLPQFAGLLSADLPLAIEGLVYMASLTEDR